MLLRLQLRLQNLIFILELLAGILETGQLVLKAAVFLLVLVDLE